MTAVSSFKVADQFFLNRHHVQSHVPVRPVRPVDLPLHHLAVIDCSGSMSGDLPQIRTQLKNRIPSLIRDGDSISIIWFSGRDQFGTLIEGYRVNDAKDLSHLNTAIDRFLKPMGLTGFKQPLEEVAAVIKRLGQHSYKGELPAFSLFFMSDGYDNQWSESDILKIAESLQHLVSTAVVVEYGYYCNRNLLAKIAERVGGSSIFAEGFRQYDPAFEAAMKRRVHGGRKIELQLADVPLHQFAYAVGGDGEVITFAVSGDAKILVPEDLNEVFYFTGYPVDTVFDRVAEQELPLYAALSIFSQRMLSNEVLRVLKATGDARFINMFANCFGKQKYSDFQTATLEAVKDPSKRLIDGYNPNLVPREDAFTVLDLLYELASDEGNLFYPNHPLFEYNRTGRKAVQTASVLNEDEVTELGLLTAQMGATRDAKKIKELQEKVSAIVDRKRDSIQFEATNKNAGYPVSKLTLNESRPNVSALVRIEGTVGLDLSAAGAPTTLPNRFPTFIWRNYTIVRDGIINVQSLPVSLTRETFERLQRQGVLVSHTYSPGFVYEIDLRRLPVVNRKMVKEISADRLFRLEYDLTKLKGAQKVFNHFYKANFEKDSADFKTAYGEAATNWLKDLGITSGGFSPKTTLAEATDFYLGKELKVALAGLSSLPKVEETLAKINDKKPLKPSEKMLEAALREVLSFFEADFYKKSNKQEELLKVWLDDRQKTTKELVRSLARELAQIKFSVIVAQQWFKEFASLDDNTMTIKIDGGTEINCTVTMKETEVKI